MQHRPDGPAPEPQRILFIGNSLTAANNLPEMFRALAAAGHHPTPIVSSVVRANYSLEDHWNEGAAQQATVNRREGYPAISCSRGELRSTSIHLLPSSCSKPHKRLQAVAS